MSNAEIIAALSEALDDEYRARATYHKVIERFGPARLRRFEHASGRGRPPIPGRVE